jgi:hypothetical protein
MRTGEMPKFEISSFLNMPQAGPAQYLCQTEQLIRLGMPGLSNTEHYS